MLHGKSVELSITICAGLARSKFVKRLFLTRHFRQQPTGRNVFPKSLLLGVSLFFSWHRPKKKQYFRTQR